MACIYTYNGKEFTSKGDLVDYLKFQNPTTISNNVQKSEISNEDRLDLEANALKEYGTYEFLRFTSEDGKQFVSVDIDALGQIASPIKQFKKSDGSYVDVNIEEVAEDENHPARKIDGVENAVMGVILDRMINNMEEEMSQGGETTRDLKGKLYSFLSKLGINVSIENLQEKYGDDTEGLANAFDRIIKISNRISSEELTPVLAEETAHIAIELSSNQEDIERMLEKVNETAEYKANAEQYRARYAKEGKTKEQVERKVRKEVLGKILAVKILDNFNKENATNSTETGMFHLLEKLWNGVLDFFKISEENRSFFVEFGQILDALSGEVIAENTEEFTNTSIENEVYYSLTEEGKELRIKLLNSLEALGGKHDLAVNEGARRFAVQRIKENIQLGDFFLAAQAQVRLLSTDIEKATDVISESKRDNPGDPYAGVSGIDSMSIMIASATLEDNLQTLEQILLDHHTNDLISKKEVESIENDIQNVRGQYNSIRSDLNKIISKTSLETTYESLREAGATEKDIQKVIQSLGTQTDITAISRWLKSVPFIGHPLAQVIVYLVLKSKSVAQEKGRAVINIVEDYLLKHNITAERAQSLNDGYSMTHQFLDALREYLERYQEEQNVYLVNLRSDMIAEAEAASNGTPEGIAEARAKAKDAFDLEKDIVLELARFKNKADYQVRPEVINNRDLKERSPASIGVYRFGDLVRTEDGEVVGEVLRKDANKIYLRDDKGKEVEIEITRKLTRIDDFVAINPGAKKEIRNHSSAKHQILRRYDTGNGTYDLSSITAEDAAELSAVISAFRRVQSEYTDAGLRKKGDSLSIAKHIKRYYKIKTFSSDGLTPEMLSEFRQEEAKAKAQGSVFFERWKKVNGTFTYKQEVFDQMEGGSTIDEEASGTSITNTYKNTILNNLGITEREFTTYQDLYDRLKNKRSELIAPYKEMGKFNEIKGDLIDSNTMLRDSIDTVTDLMGMFKRQQQERDTSGLKFNAVGNTAYQKQISILEGRELSEFQNRHTTTIAGKKVVKTFYYRTYEITREDGSSVEKNLRPSFNWIMAKGNKREINPNYSENLAKKGITQYSEFIKRKFRNDEFFTKFGIDPNTDFYAQGEASREKDLFGLREILLEQKSIRDRKEGNYNSYYVRPSVAVSSAKELVIDKGNLKKTGGKLFSLFAKNFLLETDDDESGLSSDSLLESGEQDKKVGGITSIFGGVSELKYKNRLFTRYRRILRDKNGAADPSLLSQDVTYSYLAYIQEGIDVEEKGNVLPKITAITERLKATKLGGKSYEGSELKSALDTFLSSVLLGQTMDAGYVIEVFGKKFSTTKISRTLKHVGTITNLGFNMPVALTGLMNASFQIAADRLVGNIVGSTNVTFANSEIMTNLLGDWTKTAGELNPNSKAAQMLRLFTVNTTNEYNQGLMNGRVYRLLSENVGMTQYELVSSLTALRASVMVSDSYRLVTIGFKRIDAEGKVTGSYTTREKAEEAYQAGETISEIKDFKPLREFKESQKEALGEEYNEKAAEDLFNSLRNKSYYSYVLESGRGIDISRLAEDGFLDGFGTNIQNAKQKQDILTSRIDGIKSRMNRSVNAYHAEKEGQLADVERSSAQYSALFSHLFFHKGWMVRQLAQRINPEYFDLNSSTWNEGSYSTLGRLSFTNEGNELSKREVLKMYGAILTMGLYKGSFKNLSELEQTNMRRIQADLALLVVTGALFMLGAAAMDGDDDDDSLAVQYAAYIATRNFNEVLSSQLPFVLSEYKSTLENPFGSLSMAADLIASPFNILGAAVQGGDVSRGRYKGSPKWVKELIKVTAMKNLYKITDAGAYKDKNILLRNQSFLMSNLHDLIYGED